MNFILQPWQFLFVVFCGWVHQRQTAIIEFQNDELTALLQRLGKKRLLLTGRPKPPFREPNYPPTERMAILELRAARGWSQQKTADVVHLTAATIASWMKRLDEAGPDALVQLRESVNRFPDFVRYAVQRLKSLCPSMGKVKIAEVLARGGLHLGSTTVGRILKEQPALPPVTGNAKPNKRHVTADRPNHVWHVDLTTVPISGGFWAPWSPFALPQCWPFCWWVAIVLDHYSRRVMGVAIFAEGRTQHVFGYSAFRQVMSQELQLGLDTRCAPGRILSGHPPNQGPYGGFDRWATWLACSRLPPPKQAKPLTMPLDDCFRLHDQQRRSPVGRLQIAPVSR